MKLFEKYNRLNITATILTFVIGSCTFYFLLNYILIRELDEKLQAEQQEIVTYTTLHNSLPEIIHTKEQYTFYQPANAPGLTIFSSGRHKYDNEEENYREIHFTVPAGGKYYLVTVATPLEETESLLQAIIEVTIAMVALILLTGYLINRTVIRRLWKPFYQTIGKMKTYHLSDQDTLALERVDIDEFSLLNQSINEMIGRIQQDYSSLKNFTGQAAHEMQTPLAIIRTRLDMLMQNENLLEQNAHNITDIEKAVHRLSRLHQSLLLLTKVENRQFALNEQVQLDVVIADKCAEYAELMEAMNLTVNLNLQPTTILFHQHLADILINNLLNNATRYNKPGGVIDIELQNNRLTISNTSATQQLDLNKLFKRFYRDDNSQEGTGLGLSIVKQICEMAGYTIDYEYSNDKHTFIIMFNQGNF